MEGPATVTVTGSGAASAPPDAARLTVAVQASVHSVPRALAAVASGVVRLGQVARQFTSAERIRSRGLAVWPRRDEIEGDVFTASHTFEIYCDSLERSGELLTALADALERELTVEGVQPVIGDVSMLVRQAREAAFVDARTKAAEMARLAGRSLGEVVSIVEGSDYDRPVVYAEAASTGPRAMPFEPGSSSVTAQVRVTWTLE